IQKQEKSQVSSLASEVDNAGLLTGNAVAATIAHEVKQPLSGMITNADAGLRWLDHSTPNLDKAKAAFEQIVTDGHRAAARRSAEAPHTGPSSAACRRTASRRRSNPAPASASELDHKRHRRDGDEGWGAAPARQ